MQKAIEWTQPTRFIQVMIINRPQNIPSVVTLEGSEIEVVDSYKYLGILIDDSLTFQPHVQYLVKRFRLKLDFFGWK